MKKKIAVILLIFSLFLTISSVSALEISENLTNFDEIDNKITNSENIIISDSQVEADNQIQQTNKEDLGYNSKSEKNLKEGSRNSSDNGSFKDLEDLINSNSDGIININKDYYFNPDTDSNLTNGIIINKSLIINGNNHILDAQDSGRILNVISNVSLTINNLSFYNGNSKEGSSILSNGTVSLNNTSFINNIANSSGGAICTYEDIVVNNSYFNQNKIYPSNMANLQGGSIYARKNVYIYNSTFENSEAKNGGAIYGLKNVYIYHSLFRNNSAYDDYISNGGAINAPNVTVKNSTFELNYALDNGGAICANGNLDAENSIFTNNTGGKRGGALGASNTIVNNCIFINNNAKFGGAISSHNKSDINNSKFISNSANYGGGAVNAERSNNSINNSIFTNNSALSYAGAVLSNNIVVMNSNFTNNSAKAYGGAILAENIDSYNNNFYNNKANNGTNVFAISNSNLGNQINEYVLLNISELAKAKYAGEINLSTGEPGFCSESGALTPTYGYLIDDMTAVRNSRTGENVFEYVKILIYEYYFNQSVFEPYAMFQFIWAFTDGNYTNYGTKYPPIQHVIDLYNSGFRIPTYNASKILKNGTVVTFNFRYFMTPNSTQNSVIFNLTYEEINETVEKETLNPEVLIGNLVEFRITLTNNGQDIINNPFIIDEDYSDGLDFIAWKIERGNWTKENNKYILNEQLNPGESRSLILIFNTTKNGILVNNVSSGYNNINISNSSNKTIVFKPEMAIEKISNNKIVKIGETVSFTIILRNTGDCNLTGVYIKDNEYSNGLVYLSYIDKNNEWDFDGKDTWTYKGTLTPGQSISLKILFKAITEGVKINTAIAGHNITNETVNSTNTTKVVKNETKNETNKNDTNKTDKIPKKADPPKDIEVHTIPKAGNPLVILLISLFALILVPRKYKK
ncbi:DUF11 domain-containing protein [Methanobrevibacter olleyae]|uniref:Adhesin-like protein n=1 Tax=Methanobrevibacter olleyae TaxID=294671 RepID=A0A126QYP6_METOL|nr:DUF11 domain-containing protein [Methanobrevibacter olleyae]AMK15270.1 adhesin-like protein [Methanobrevibacter olleyae]SFL29070.1 conserved repeat domain-containing protein [Methanobrevibacter olleyae]